MRRLLNTAWPNRRFATATQSLLRPSATSRRIGQSVGCLLCFKAKRRSAPHERPFGRGPPNRHESNGSAVKPSRPVRLVIERKSVRHGSQALNSSPSGRLRSLPPTRHHWPHHEVCCRLRESIHLRALPPKESFSSSFSATIRDGPRGHHVKCNSRGE